MASMSSWSEDTMSIGLEVQDEFTATFDKIEMRMRELGYGFQNLASVASTFGATNLSGLLAGLGAIAAPVGLAAGAVTALGVALYELDRRGDALNTHMRMIDAVSASYTGSASTISEAGKRIQAASNNVISSYQAEDVALQAVISTRGRAVDSMNEISSAARNLSAATGGDFTAAMTAILKGGQAGSAAAFDTATGGYLNMQTAASRWEAQTGQKLYNLSPTERADVFYQLAGTQAQNLATGAGIGAGPTQKESAQSFLTSVKEFFGLQAQIVGEELNLGEVFKKAAENAKGNLEILRERRTAEEEAESLERQLLANKGKFSPEEIAQIEAQIRVARYGVLVDENGGIAGMAGIGAGAGAASASQRAGAASGAAQFVAARLAQYKMSTDIGLMPLQGPSADAFAVRQTWDTMQGARIGSDARMAQLLKMADTMQQWTEVGQPMSQLQALMGRGPAGADFGAIGGQLTALDRTSGPQVKEAVNIARESAQAMEQYRESVIKTALANGDMTKGLQSLAEGLLGNDATVADLVKNYAMLAPSVRAAADQMNIFGAYANRIDPNRLAGIAASLAGAGVVNPVDKLASLVSVPPGLLDARRAREAMAGVLARTPEETASIYGVRPESKERAMALAASQQLEEEIKRRDQAMAAFQASDKSAESFKALAEVLMGANATVLDLVSNYGRLDGTIRSGMSGMDLLTASIAQLNAEASKGYVGQLTAQIAGMMGTFGSINRSAMGLGAQGISYSQAVGISEKQQAFLAPYAVLAEYLASTGQESKAMNVWAEGTGEIGRQTSWVGSSAERARAQALSDKNAIDSGLRAVAKENLAVTDLQMLQTKAGTYQDTVMEKARQYRDVANLLTMSPFAKGLVPGDIYSQGDKAIRAYSVQRAEQIENFQGAPEDYNWEALGREIKVHGARVAAGKGWDEMAKKKLAEQGISEKDIKTYLDIKSPESAQLNAADAVLEMSKEAKAAFAEMQKYYGKDKVDALIAGVEGKPPRVPTTALERATAGMTAAERRAAAKSGDALPPGPTGPDAAGAAAQAPAATANVAMNPILTSDTKALAAFQAQVEKKGEDIAKWTASGIEKAAGDSAKDGLMGAGEGLAKQVLGGYTRYLDKNMDTFVDTVAKKVSALLVTYKPTPPTGGSSLPPPPPPK